MLDTQIEGATTMTQGKMNKRAGSKLPDAKTNTTSTLHDEVREKIFVLCKKFNKSNINQPSPFSAPEMIVMALLVARKPSLAPEEILGWIFKAFKYFNNRAIDEHARARIAGSWDYTHDFSRVLRDFQAAFDCWEAPIYSIDPCQVVMRKCVQNAKFEMTTPVSEGRIFLRKWMDYDCQRRKSVSKSVSKKDNKLDNKTLLDLLPELRLIIFEMVFAFKWPGLLVREGEFRLIKRIHDQKPPVDPDEDMLCAPSIQTILSLLSVNSQTYEEALPCFYFQNIFFFDTVRDFAKFAQHTTEERRSLLTNEFIIYNSSFRRLKGFEYGAKVLSQLTNLKCLELGTCDGTWLDPNISKAVHGTHLFAEPSHLPGIQDIAFSLHQAEGFKIRGNCPRIRKFLEGEVAKLVAAGKSKEVERLKNAEKLRQAPSFKAAEKLKNAKKRKYKQTFNTSMTEPGTGGRSSQYDAQSLIDLLNDQEFSDVDLDDDELPPPKRRKRMSV
jgi:hypothetical protein